MKYYVLRRVMENNQVNKILLRMPMWVRIKCVFYSRFSFTMERSLKIFEKYMHPIPKNGEESK